MPCRLLAVALVLSVLGGSAAAETPEKYVGGITKLADAKLTMSIRKPGEKKVSEKKELTVGDKVLVVKKDRKGKEKQLSFSVLKSVVAGELARGVFASVSMAGGKVVRIDLRGEIMPEEAVQIPEEADQIELYSLQPEPSAKASKAPGATFIDEALVLGKTVIKNKEARKQVRDVLEISVGMPVKQAKCFDPGHAIRATAGKKTVQIVICFHCGHAYFYFNGKKDPSAKLSVSKAGQGDLDKILKAAGIPLAGASKE